MYLCTTATDKAYVNYCESFFEACQNSAIPCIPMDTSRVLDIADGLIPENHGINAYIVPQSLGTWPSFRASKQSDAIAKDVLCIRTDPVSKCRQELIIKRLVQAIGRVVVVGSPGIGTWRCLLLKC